MKEMIRAVADDNSFFELQEEFARNIVIGYIRLNGIPAISSLWYPVYPKGCFFPWF